MRSEQDPGLRNNLFKPKEGAPQSERLTVLDQHPGAQRLLFNIRSDSTGGDKFRRDLSMLGFTLCSEYLANLNQSPSTVTTEGPFGPIPQPIIDPAPLVIAIPRGGIPMGQGLQDLTGSSCLYTNDGSFKQENEPVLPSNFPYGTTVDTVMLTDTVTATGGAADRTIQAIREAADVKKIVYFTAITTPQAIDRLLGAHDNLYIVTGVIEKECFWAEKGGKQVLFVNGVGDAGDLASAGQPS